MVPTNAVLTERAPTMYILNPADGATVSGTVTIQTSKSGSIYIDGVLVASGVSSFNWDTTAYSDGLHSIEATRPRSSDSITVNVANGGTGDNPPVVVITSPSNGATVSGIVVIGVSVTDDIDTGLVADIYIDGVFVVHSNSYNWDTTTYSDAGHAITAEATDSGSNTDSDSVTVTVNNGGSSGGDGIVRYWAVIVGISDYKAISDLSYCDEDANDWYDFLETDFDYITVLGDNSNYFHQFDGLATESNIKQAITNMVLGADEDDVIAYLSSGHGSGDRRGMGLICCWDCSAGEDGEDGSLYDYEFDDLIAPAVAGRIFIFLDHCYSGAFGPELMALANSANIYVATTCTYRGYGYDDPTHLNGMWTYYFLEFAWISHFGGSHTVALEAIFDYAFANYPRDRRDAPQEFDGAVALFYLF